MPHHPRIDLPGTPHHVIQRGNNRAACFFADDDYYCYLHWLKKAANDHGVAIHAYVLMTNHVHLLVTPGKPGALSAMMQSLGRRYVRYINATYKRTGTLWEGRFKAGVIDDESYLLKVYRYIELNPVRANLVAHPGQYMWSSYPINADGKASELVVPHERYLALGLTRETRLTGYAALFSTEPDANATERIRSAVNLGIGVNDARFREEADAAHERKKGGRPRKETGNGNKQTTLFWLAGENGHSDSKDSPRCELRRARQTLGGDELARADYRERTAR